MPFDLAISEHGDLVMSGSRDLAGISGSDQTGQRVQIRLRLHRGTWFYDEDGTLGSLLYMGGTAANRITAGISGISGGSLGAVGGSEGVTLTTAQIPAHTHPITDPGHIHDVLGGGGVSSGSTMIRTTSDGTAGGVSGMIISHTTGITVGNNAGGGGAHPIVQPVIVVNKLMRAL